MESLENGVLRPSAQIVKSDERHQVSLRETFRTLRQLKRKFPNGKKDIDELEEMLQQFLVVLSKIIGAFRGLDESGEEAILSPHTVDMYISIWSRACRALKLESSELS